MASEVQKPLAKMEFLLDKSVASWLPLVSSPAKHVSTFLSHPPLQMFDNCTFEFLNTVYMITLEN